MDDPLTLAIIGGFVGGASSAVITLFVNQGLEHILKNHDCAFRNAYL